ncbi:hypothetical protein PR202_ga07450 [Eleusine coracana subsp. coracana]|uniref:Uncharacterized protein n=1 Tax=Eleusine coracana subsp. coracana TaxID=191504 RepID=A0AAV5BYJ4_ELECO|nr:hypothetical protein PR202_ga07450 [Eleusine coracana subsp. coracana]
MPRESVASCSIDGYKIPARTRVFVNTYAMGHEPTIQSFASTSSLWPCMLQVSLASILLYHSEWALPAGVRAEDVESLTSVRALGLLGRRSRSSWSVSIHNFILYFSRVSYQI